MALIFKKDRHLLLITNTGLNETVRYNLKEQRMQNFSKRTKSWVYTKYPQYYFRNQKLADIESTDKKFQTCFKLIKLMNGRLRNIGSFLLKFKDIAMYENYIEEELEFEYRKKRNSYWSESTLLAISKPLSFYDRTLIKLFKKYNFKITCDFEKLFINDYEYFKKALVTIDSLDLPIVVAKQVFCLFNDSWDSEKLKELTNDYNYDLKSLLKYVVLYLKPFENLDFDRSLGLLRDYNSMAKDIGRSCKKYPKYLRSMHDIFQANYKAFKKEYDEIKFAKLIKSELDYIGKKYCFIAPKKSIEIIYEGTELNHCVSSYIDRILQEKTYIFFMRLKKAKDKSLITLELIDNVITQAKGSYNRALTKEEKTVLSKYCKLKDFKTFYDIE